jgi:hypothetical protein
MGPEALPDRIPVDPHPAVRPLERRDGPASYQTFQERGVNQASGFLDDTDDFY